jgi:alkanesulfonate monooxygenase SsuD/methylene tetrahydromethanopterin reductase-like flavin-dependent oxidoreductase (luciferase family)
MRFGVNIWAQNTTWDRVRELAQLIDQLGFDSLWVWDHFYAVYGDTHRPNLEGWQLLSALATTTSSVKLGCLVSAVTHRNPAVLANMATTNDNISNGRTILGLGAAWNVAEHLAYGMALGTPAERSRRLAEAARLIRRLVDGERVTHDGRYYQMTEAEVLTRPIQPRLPILIGGGGERSTLRTAARYADMWHTGGTAEQMAHKLEVLRAHCSDVGRALADVLALGTRWIVVRDNAADGRRTLDRVVEEHQLQLPVANPIIGDPDEVAAELVAYWRIGVGGFIVHAAEPFDIETIERLAKEVLPRVDRLIAAAPALR